MRILVVGPSWYGNWVEYFYEELRDLGVESGVVFTNTISGGGSIDKSSTRDQVIERVKKILLKISPWVFDLIKKVGKKKASRELVRKVKSYQDDKKTTFVIFVWTPPGVRLLRHLKNIPNTKLVYWIGEPLSRDPKWSETLSYFDHLFMVDKEEWVGGLGKAREKAELLPLASSEKVFKPLDLSPEDKKKFSRQITFVGLYRPQRAEMMSPVKDYDFMMYGYGWEGSEKEFPWLEGKLGGPVPLEDLNKIFCGADICIGSLGISFEENLPTLTQRVVDIALAGNFQLSQWNPLTEEVFGESVPLFRSGEELEGLIKHYIDKPEERRRLAERSRQVALKNTWGNRAKKVVEILGASLKD